MIFDLFTLHLKAEVSKLIIEKDLIINDNKLYFILPRLA